MVSINRTSEGVIVDVFDKSNDSLGTLALEDNDFSEGFAQELQTKGASGCAARRIPAGNHSLALPASERGFTGLDDSKKYLFTCKQCGCTEFADLSESMAECDNCSTQYVFRYCG